MVGTELKHYYINKQQIDFIQEYCILISKDCWEDCGPWPEELPLIGMSFIMTIRAQVKGYKPQATGNKIVHHYQSFSMDPSEFERMGEQAMGVVGKLMQAAHK